MSTKLSVRRFPYVRTKPTAIYRATTDIARTPRVTARSNTQALSKQRPWAAAAKISPRPPRSVDPSGIRSFSMKSELLSDSVPMASRKLGQQERLFITRRNAGYPACTTILITYPSPEAMPSDSFLSARISELQDHFPLLRTRAVDVKTRTPRFELREQPWNTAEILHTEAFQHEDVAIEKERILFEEVNRMEAQDLEVNPMWRVAVFAPSASSRAHIALSTNHLITDGMGMLKLCQALLAPSITDLPYESLSKIPVLEDTISVRPTLGHLLPVVWTELVLPLLPESLQSMLRAPRSWPAERIRTPPMQAPWDVSMLSIPAALIPALKAAGAANGVPALHMTLQVAYALAIWHVFGNTMTPFSFEMAAYRSERQAQLGHAHCTGNYLSTYETQFRPEADADFWAMTAKHSEHFRSPAGIARGRGVMGLLAYVPDPRPDPAMRDTPMPTGWERFFLEKADSPTPFDWGLAISNLGAITLPPGAEDAVWAEGASPFGPALEVQMLGHEAGLQLTTIWREGSAVDRADAKSVEQAFVKILERLASGESKGLTCAQLVG